MTSCSSFLWCAIKGCMFVLVLAWVLVCICECFSLSESTLDHDCVTLQHGGKDIKNRCGLLSPEYGEVVLKGGAQVLCKTFPHYWLLILWYVWAISRVLRAMMINWNGRGVEKRQWEIWEVKSSSCLLLTSYFFIAFNIKLAPFKL